MNVISDIQARMSSVRLPGKVLMQLVGKPVLEHVVTRIQVCTTISKVIVATSTDPTDNIIQSWCESQGISCYRGSLDDVLDRYYQAAKTDHPDAVVRITADCPAIDPTIVDEVVTGFLEGGYLGTLIHIFLEGQYLPVERNDVGFVYQLGLGFFIVLGP